MLRHKTRCLESNGRGLDEARSSNHVQPAGIPGSATSFAADAIAAVDTAAASAWSVDTTIPTAEEEFAGCLVCHRKTREDVMLLCDGCDNPYHIFCLDPPLPCLPPEDEIWLCYECKELQRRFGDLGKSAMIIDDAEGQVPPEVPAPPAATIAPFESPPSRRRTNTVKADSTVGSKRPNRSLEAPSGVQNTASSSPMKRPRIDPPHPPQYVISPPQTRSLQHARSPPLQQARPPPPQQTKLPGHWWDDHALATEQSEAKSAAARPLDAPTLFTSANMANGPVDQSPTPSSQPTSVSAGLFSRMWTSKTSLPQHLQPKASTMVVSADVPSPTRPAGAAIPPPPPEPAPDVHGWLRPGERFGRCCVCHVPATRKCSLCCEAEYCSVTCQWKHWSWHERDCRGLASVYKLHPAAATGMLVPWARKIAPESQQTIDPRALAQ